MAAGVTDRLWEMGDLVNLLEAFEAAQRHVRHKGKAPAAGIGLHGRGEVGICVSAHSYFGACGVNGLAAKMTRCDIFVRLCLIQTDLTTGRRQGTDGERDSIDLFVMDGPRRWACPGVSSLAHPVRLVAHFHQQNSECA